MLVGGGAGSLYILLRAVSSRSFRCGFNYYACVTGGGGRGPTTGLHGLTFKTIIVTLESPGRACYKTDSLELTSMGSDSVGMEWSAGVSIAHGLRPSL